MAKTKQKPMEIYVHQVTSASHVQTFDQLTNADTLFPKRTLYPDDDASVYSVGSSYSQAFHADIFENSNYSMHYGPSTSSPLHSPIYDSNFQISNTSQIDSTRPDSEIDPYSTQAHNQNLPRVDLPQVVVWSPITDDHSEKPNESSYSEKSYDQIQGRARSAAPAPKMNFSRPRREPTSVESDAHKREVLERNGYRTSPRKSPPPLTQKNDSLSHNTIENSPVRYFIPPPSHKETYAFDTGHDPPNFSEPSDLPVSSQSSNSRPFVEIHIPSSVSTMANDSAHLKKQIINSSQIPSPSEARPNTPESVYSQYSYYHLDSETSSPNIEGKDSIEGQILSLGKESLEDQGVTKRFSRVMQAISSSPMLPSSTQVAQSAEDYLQLGIKHHEANKLEQSARFFERSATENGGCVIGMLMWGLSLRHGWGCKSDEKTAFMWIRKAAEHALVVLESAKQDRQALKTELVLAVYEVGQCFYRGWGVRQDKKMGFSYFQTAAQLGDPDAQQDLAFCLANGKGCKKDRKAAAKWYRAAVEQGASTVGLAWIYKSKYMD